ncbi:protein APCDD1-like [Patiria miniata]|uniref:APCDD1 domain-containing protein n=1 Tax=Patiria miniata TaxID=46514 RepID=A0A914AU32_PATMI|nr:protein APCDD1-like [Patiria miniata]
MEVQSLGLVITVSFLVLCGLASAVPSGNQLDSHIVRALSESECGAQMRRLQGNEGVSAIVPPRPKGEWVSMRCEVRPGPEFILRRYKFHSDSSFSLHQFFYTDDQCRHPAYSLKIRGTIALGQQSWVVSGATEAEYHVSKVTMVVYDETFGRTLRSQVNRTCPGFFSSSNDVLELYQRYVIVDWEQESTFTECTEAMDFAMHELQIVRQEFHSEFNTGIAKFVSWEELFLGDIHTDRKQRMYYRPRAYQPPLRKYQANCSFCQLIHNTEEFNPPLLPARTEYQVSLRSEWVSTRCEVRKIHFVIRHLVFHNNYTWEGYFFYFRDPMCQHPVYSIYVKGAHSDGTMSEIVTGGTEFEFVTSQMWVTPKNSEEVVKFNKNDDDCGAAGSWRLNQPQEVTGTGGCSVIGITLPHTESELMRMEQGRDGKALLFNRERPTDGDLSLEKPTSYQSPLRHCAGVNPLIDITVTYENNEENSGTRLRTCYALQTLVWCLWICIYLLRH